MDESLKNCYRTLLRKHQRTTNGHRYTLPSPRVYPCQWLWDSCFHSIIYTHFDLQYAKDEIRALLSAQWENGMLPHMIYWEQHVQHQRNWGTDGKTSCLTQPPMVAYAVERVVEQGNDKEFAAEVLGPMHRYYQWLERERGCDGVLSIVHPWESGQDDLASWDEVYGVHDPDRETLLQYKLQLLSDYVQCGWDEKAFFKTGNFNVQCLLFNCVYLRNLVSMKNLCKKCGSTFHEYYQKRVPEYFRAFRKHFFNHEHQTFVSTRNHTCTFLQWETPALFMPLFAGLATEEEASSLVERFLIDPNKFALPFPLPTLSADNELFTPERYWRGSVWQNINWFVIKGLRDYGFQEHADHLKTAGIALAEKSGFAEYYNPFSGESCAGPELTWSGLVFDM